MNSTCNSDEDNVVDMVKGKSRVCRELFETSNETSRICDETEYVTALESESILDEEPTSESILEEPTNESILDEETNDSVGNLDKKPFVIVDTFNDEIEFQEDYGDECTSIFLLSSTKKRSLKYFFFQGLEKSNVVVLDKAPESPC